MDDIRDSLSSLKKKLKHPFRGSSRKRDGTGADGREERANPSGSLPQPEPHVMAGGGRDQEESGSNAGGENVETSAAADENRSGWGSTVSGTAKLLLRGARDSADVFPPLKSVAGGLCFVLENSEVWPPPSYVTYDAYRCLRERRQTSRR